MPRPDHPTIVVFDSGLGGLTVFREVVKARPDARYVYLADDARFPYGRIPEAELVARVLAVIRDAIAAWTPDLIIIACNTASTLALAPLRAAFTVPFVGTVPAIKPACAHSRSKLVSVLGTEATVAREYTKSLIREFAQDCDVTLVGAARLAAFAEAQLNGTPATDAELRAEIAPCFVEHDGKRTDTVALACTHYPLLLDRLTALAPWPVDWIDPAPAIARRVIGLIGAPTGQMSGLANGLANGLASLSADIVFTSGRPPAPHLMQALAAFGFTSAATPHKAALR